MTPIRPRRFYRAATAVAEDADGWSIRLDGRPARTPEGTPLRVPGEALARAIAAEWQAQGETVVVDAMPLTRLAATALDRIGRRRAATVAAIAAYAATDLLCYRADSPLDLQARQHRAWQPLLDWAAGRFGARLRVTEGVVPVAQPAPALAGLAAAVAAYDDLALTALASAVQATGSLIIGLALIEGRIDAAAAFAAALLDEHYQAERWGTDAEAEERRRRLAADIAEARRFLDLARGGCG